MAVSLSKEEVVSLALSNDKSLEIEKLSLENSINANNINTLLPSISINAGFNYSGSILNGSYDILHPMDSMLNNSYGILTPIVSTVFNFSIDTKSKYNKDQKELNISKENLVYEKSSKGKELSITYHYWKTAYKLLSLELLKNYLETTSADYENLKVKYEEGKISDLVLAQAELALKDAEMSFFIEQKYYETYLSTLEYLTGTGELTLSTPDFTCSPLLPLESLYELYSQTLTYKIANLDLENAKLTDKINHNNLVSPTCSFSANVGLSTQLYLNYRGQGWNNQFNISDNTYLSAMVSIPLDHLFSSSTASVTLENSKNDIEKWHLNLNNGIDKLKTNIRSLYTTLENNLQNQENYKIYLTLTKKQLEKTQESYDNGYISFTELKSAKKLSYRLS